MLVLPLRSLSRTRTGDWRRQGLQLHSSESATHSWFGQESCCWNSRGTGIVGSLSLCFFFIKKREHESLSVSLFQRGLFFVFFFFVCWYGMGTFMPIQNGCGSSGDDDWTGNSVCWVSGYMYILALQCTQLYAGVYMPCHAMCGRNVGTVVPYRANVSNRSGKQNPLPQRMRTYVVHACMGTYASYGNVQSMRTLSRPQPHRLQQHRIVPHVDPIIWIYAETESDIHTTACSVKYECDRSLCGSDL